MFLRDHTDGSFITLYLLAFYVIFECVLNVFAEVTRFADRGFYDAWWNSVTWDQVLRPFILVTNC